MSAARAGAGAPAQPVILIDTREQAPLAFSHLEAEAATLATGDYSVKGLEDDFTVERKSMADLLGSLTHDRERFFRELQRMRAYSTRLLLVVGTTAELHSLLARRKISLPSIQGSLAGIEARGIPVAFYGTPAAAARKVESMAFYAWRQRLRGLAPVEIPAWAREDMQERMNAAGWTAGQGKGGAI